MPPARWCEWCTLGRAVEPAHKRLDRSDDDRHITPLISMDFGVVKATGDTIEDVEKDMGTTLVVMDDTTGLIRAIPMAGKHPADYAATGVTGFIRSLYVGKCRLRCDNEPSIVAVAVKVKEKLPDRVVVEHSPK